MNIRSLFGVIVQFVFWFLPTKLSNALRRRLFGWDLAPDAQIGFSLFKVRHVVMYPGSVVGHFNVIRNLEIFEIGTRAQVGHFNRISGRPDVAPDYLSSIPRRSIFTLGRESAITHRHYFDCTHSITIGDFVTIAGSHSQFWSHGLDVELCRQTALPISVGNYCMIGTRVTILKGVSISDYCVVAAGSVVNRSLDKYVLAGGVPATKIRNLEPDLLYFTRVSGAIN